MLQCNSQRRMPGFADASLSRRREMKWLPSLMALPASRLPQAARDKAAAPGKSLVRPLHGCADRIAHAAGPPRNCVHAHRFAAVLARRARQPAGQDRRQATCRSASDGLKLSPVRSRPGVPARGGFVFSAVPQHQRDPAVERNAALEHEAPARDRSPARHWRAPAAGRRARMRAPGAARRLSGTASRISGPSRILAKIRS